MSGKRTYAKSSHDGRGAHRYSLKRGTHILGKTEIQSIIFKKQYWTIPRAKAWLARHKHKPIKKVDITANYYRFRLRPPNTGPKRSLRFKKSVLAVIQNKMP